MQGGQRQPAGHAGVVHEDGGDGGAGDGLADGAHEDVDAVGGGGLRGRDGAEDQGGERRVGEGGADGHDGGADHDHDQGAAVGDAHAVTDGDDGGAQGEGDPRSAGGRDAGGDRGEQQHDDAARQQDEAGLDDGQAESVAGGLGGLHELRGDERVGVEGEAGEEGGHVGETDAGPGDETQVHEGAVGVELVAPPDGEDENGAGEEADDRGAPPSPGAALGHGEEQADEAGGQSEGAGDVEAAALPHR